MKTFPQENDGEKRKSFTNGNNLICFPHEIISDQKSCLKRNE
jgi:hypothetical protein